MRESGCEELLVWSGEQMARDKTMNDCSDLAGSPIVGDCWDRLPRAAFRGYHARVAVTLRGETTEDPWRENRNLRLIRLHFGPKGQ
jgi:hypothetical protein